MTKDYFTIKYRPCAAAPFSECLFKCFLSPGPAPLCPQVNHHPKVLIPAIFNEIRIIRQSSVSLKSALMSLNEFLIYCLYMIIYFRHTRQGILPQHIHVRACACARGIFVSDIYFKFVRKQSDQTDALNASADLRADGTPDAPLTYPDGINERVLPRGRRLAGNSTLGISLLLSKNRTGKPDILY